MSAGAPRTPVPVASAEILTCCTCALPAALLDDTTRELKLITYSYVSLAFSLHWVIVTHTHTHTHAHTLLCTRTRTYQLIVPP